MPTTVTQLAAQIAQLQAQVTTLQGQVVAAQAAATEAQQETAQLREIAETAQRRRVEFERAVRTWAQAALVPMQRRELYQTMGLLPTNSYGITAKFCADCEHTDPDTIESERQRLRETTEQALLDIADNQLEVDVIVNQRW